MPGSADHGHDDHRHHAHAGHNHAPATAAASLAPAIIPSGFQPLASTAGARLMRVGIAIAVLWAAVAWALAS